MNYKKLNAENDLINTLIKDLKVMEHSKFAITKHLNSISNLRRFMDYSYRFKEAVNLMDSFADSNKSFTSTFYRIHNLAREQRSSLEAHKFSIHSIKKAIKCMNKMSRDLKAAFYQRR